jgi:hypothetical protein
MVAGIGERARERATEAGDDWGGGFELVGRSKESSAAQAGGLGVRALPQGESTAQNTPWKPIKSSARGKAQHSPASSWVPSSEPALAAFEPSPSASQLGRLQHRVYHRRRAHASERAAASASRTRAHIALCTLQGGFADIESNRRRLQPPCSSRPTCHCLTGAERGIASDASDRDARGRAARAVR